MTARAERSGADPGLSIALAAGMVALGAIAGHTVAGSTGMVVGGLAALAPLAVRSWSPRRIARLVLSLSGLLLLRRGVLSGSILAGSQVLLAWLVAAVSVLVLSDRLTTEGRPAAVASRPGDGGGRSRTRLVGTIVAITLAVVLFALVVTPLVLPRMSSTSEAGEGPRLGDQESGSSVLRASDELDMTTRPELTDEVVFTVTADRGTFWRGQTYDQWDGRTWTQSEPGRFAVGLDGEVSPGFDDLGAGGEDEVEQRVRFEASYADVLFAAASAVRVDAGRTVAQRADGTLVTAGAPFGRGGTYTVVSRRPVLSEARLRAAEGEVPAEIRRRYAAAPETSDRVRDAAADATRGATTTYDRVRALERWMGQRTEYSLDAPLSPSGVDVVDHFLFESRQGWCEQIASSLVVLARAEGIPARLVTGFVPGELDRVTGTWVVRQHHAHAWAEVWFPEVGWVPFDPTADVPLAGADHRGDTLGRWLLDHAVVLVLGAAASALLVVLAVTGVRRWRRRRAERPTGWVAVTDARLEALGRRVQWPRSDAETATAFAASLARHLQQPRLGEVGVAIDTALYAAHPPDDATRARIDDLLDELADAEVPRAERAPEPVAAP